MNIINRSYKKISFINVYLMAYFIVSLLFLTQFPVMHSDESWLSGLTRSMMHGNLASTETFFDLFPRYPHAIKTLFHLLQMLSITIFDYNLFAVRLLSLLFGIGCLFVFYKLSKIFLKPLLATLVTILLSLDIQFIYASHFARQEIIILFFMLCSVYYVMFQYDTWSIRNDIITATLVGLTIGIHPNSFVVALVMGAVYLYYIFIEKKLKLINLLALISGVIVFASIFVSLSFLFNNTFIRDYFAYGEALGVTNTSINKFKGLFGYYQRLFSTISVTYYTAPIKLQFMLFSTALLIATTAMIFHRKYSYLLKLLLPLLAINIGFMIIGRYSQPGIIFIFPFCYLLICVIINELSTKAHYLCAGLCLIICTHTVIGISPYLNNNYKTYIESIQNIVPSDAAVLANLNTEYAFDYGNLYDYRNLTYLENNDITFAQYIENRNIKFIIYPEEMDYIYDNRPVWNVMYGNIYPYYEEMQSFLNDHCALITEFNSPYAMRIMNLADTKEWSVKIYAVNSKEIQ